MRLLPFGSDGASSSSEWRAVEKGILEIAESICYNMPRQKRYECSIGATKTPRGANSWGFLFRFGKGGLCPRLVANYSSLSSHLQM
jgi:hypothetical protein